MPNYFVDSIRRLLEEAMQILAWSAELRAEARQRAVEQPPNPEMGDYAFPCFSFAKALKKAPPIIAKDLAQALSSLLPSQQDILSVQALGPYVNFHVSLQRMASVTLPAIKSAEYFRENAALTREKVMIEFSQPNTHKGFHVGHMRNVALGDSLVRIFRYNGFPVVAANYIGDVGAHIAKCLWYYLSQPNRQIPEHNRGEWLGELYTKATLKLEDATGDLQKGYQREISEILQKLEAKEPELDKIWLETREWSLTAFNEIYQWLDVPFDHVFYESEVDQSGKKLVLDYTEKGVFQHSQGAIGLDLQAQDLGFFLLLKSDGTTLYSTKDLALAQLKFERFQIARSIHVVGSEQALHFKQVFATLRQMGYTQAKQCFHLSYGLVVLPSGKMSSRQGNVILFSKLRQEMNEYIQNNYLNQHRGQWPEEEITETTRRVAVAAIKYGMLNQDSNKQIIFKMEDWLASEGDTGTYLVYAYVRIRSICKQIGRDIPETVDFALYTHPHELALIRALYDFNEIVWQAGESFRSSLLARYLYDLAKMFSRAYSSCSVKFAESEQIQGARLYLFHAVAETLYVGLGLIGITPPERM